MKPTNQKSIELYSHQVPVVEKLMDFVEENLERPSATGFVVLPGGSGKTVIFSDFVKRMNSRTIIISPTLTILEQNMNTMKEMSPEIRLSSYGGDQKDLSGDVVFTTYHSLVSLLRNEKINRDFARVVIFDEGHRSLSEKRSVIPEKLNALCIAFTATDKFSEQRNVEKIFKKEIYRMNLKEAIELGILLPLRGFIIETKVNLTQVKLQNRNQLDDAVAEKHLNILARNKVVKDYYLEYFKNIPSVFFCISVAHSIDMAKYLSESGIKAEAVHSGIKGYNRREILKKFNQRKIDVLCSCDVLIEGWDSQIVVAEFNLRPTYSWVLAEQRVCRVVRPHKSKNVGIVVEIQDQYNKRDQPILVHHLFGLKTYRQGGYIHATKKQIALEKKKLDSGDSFEVLKGLKVSKNVRELVNVGLSHIYDSKFQDKKLIRDILLSADEDYHVLPFTKFLNLEFNHVAFHSTGKNLIRRYLGPLWKEQKEDYELFIADILGQDLFNEFSESYYRDGDGIHNLYLERDFNFNFENIEADEEMMADRKIILKSLRKDISRVLNTLSKREIDVLSMYFGLPEYFEDKISKLGLNDTAKEFYQNLLEKGEGMMLEEISECIGITRERVRQIKERGLRRIRKSGIKTRLLTQYTEFIVFGKSGMSDVDWEKKKNK